MGFESFPRGPWPALAVLVASAALLTAGLVQAGALPPLPLDDYFRSGLGSNPFVGAADATAAMGFGRAGRTAGLFPLSSGFSVSGAVRAAPAVRWQPLAASFAGDGCPGPESARLAFKGDAPNRISIELLGFRVDMAPGGGVLVDHRSCRVRVPFTVPRGYALASARQQISAGLQKSDGGRGYLTTRNRIGRLLAEPVDLTFPYTGRALAGEGSVRLAAISRADLPPALAQPQFRVERTIYQAGPHALCAAGADEEATLESLIELHGERSSPSDVLRIEDEAQKDIGLGFELALAPCVP